MGRYRKRPVEVEARQFTADPIGQRELVEWVGQAQVHERVRLRDMQRITQLDIWVEKGGAVVTLDVGDWVIAERDGDGFYPCTAEQFAETYEEVR